MEWIIEKLVANETIISAGLTFLLSVLGAKKLLAGKLNTVFVITKETLELVMVLSKSLKSDEDGKIRIDKSELKEIQEEASDLKRALGQVIALR